MAQARTFLVRVAEEVKADVAVESVVAEWDVVLRYLTEELEDHRALEVVAEWIQASLISYRFQ